MNRKSIFVQGAFDLIQLFSTLLSMFLNGIFLNLPTFSGDILELLVFAALVIIGIVILIFLIKIALWLIPAAIVAFIVWFLTSSLWLAGIAFLIIAALSLIRKI